MQDGVKTALVTGGMGFIGRSLVDKLISEGKETHVLDKTADGALLKRWSRAQEFRFFKADLLDAESFGTLPRYDAVYHLAANPEVNPSKSKPVDHFNQNIAATFNLLERLKNAKPNILAFTSTSTVYGEASQIPTPENYSPLEPISVYGSSKLACEALISSYAHMFDFKAVIFRLANIIGPNSTHGIISDFVKRLQGDPSSLDILGDGEQNKSYLYVDDCISAIQLALKKARKKVEVFNVGSEDRIRAKDIARLVLDEMNLKKTKINYAGGADGGRGWKGDVKDMMLDIEKLRSIGWNPEHSSKKGVKLTAGLILKGGRQDV